jgi:hypothetical protein
MVVQHFSAKSVKNKFNIMKNFIIFLISTLLTSSCSSLQGINIIAKSSKQSSQQFLSGGEDIPIMAEMKKISDESSIGYDSKNGSVASSSYITALNQEEIIKFYNQTLPQLGWQLVNQAKTVLNFRREKQRLAIEFVSSSDAKNVVVFLVTNQV